MKTMLFNPYSGKPRHPLDIASDPEGKLMIDPDEPLYAAPMTTPAAADDARDAAEVWNEAIEAAARRIENGSFLHDKSPAKLFANELTPVIRSMKRAPAAKPADPAEE